MSNARTKPARSIRYRQSRMLAFASRCKYCKCIVDDGDDDCLNCFDRFGTLPPPVTIQYRETHHNGEFINAEVEEVRYATDR